MYNFKFAKTSKMICSEYYKICFSSVHWINVFLWETITSQKCLITSIQKSLNIATARQQMTLYLEDLFGTVVLLTTLALCPCIFHLSQTNRSDHVLDSWQKLPDTKLLDRFSRNRLGLYQGCPHTFSPWADSLASSLIYSIFGRELPCWLWSLWVCQML